MTGRCTRWETWLPGSGGRLKVLKWNLHLFQLLEIIQVLDSISWVRCASGNVFFYLRKTFFSHFEIVDIAAFDNCFLIDRSALSSIGKKLRNALAQTIPRGNN